MILNKMVWITAGLLVLILGLIYGVSYPEHKVIGVLIMFGGLSCAINGIGYGDNKK